MLHCKASIRGVAATDEIKVSKKGTRVGRPKYSFVIFTFFSFIGLFYLVTKKLLACSNLANKKSQTTSTRQFGFCIAAVIIVFPLPFTGIPFRCHSMKD